MRLLMRRRFVRKTERVLEMGSLEDALKKAGLSSNEAEEEKKNDSRKPAEAKQHSERRPDRRPDRKPEDKAPSEPVEPRPCGKCGTEFTPKLAKHKLCPKCADEEFSKSKERAGSGEGKPGERTDKPGDKPRGDRPPREKREPRPDRPPRPESAPREGRPEGERRPR